MQLMPSLTHRPEGSQVGDPKIHFFPLHRFTRA
jgi:hypothetical protein